MGDKTAISWADYTFNGWIGCTKVSTEATGGGACDFCYAERDFDLRKHVAKWGVGETRHKTKTWGEPLKWNRQAEAFRAKHGHWPRVFAMSLADVFDNEVPDEWHTEFNGTVEATPNLRWMLTTKRGVNIPKMTPPDFFRRNQHAGVIISICNQPEADRDVPRILELKERLGIAWVGISAEPLLGPVDLRHLRNNWNQSVDMVIDALEGKVGAAWKGRGSLTDRPIKTHLDWVIAGGESGPHARPSHPDWFRSLRDQCAAAGVPFHFKQFGEWAEVNPGVRHKTVDWCEYDRNRPDPDPDDITRAGDLFIAPSGHVVASRAHSKPNVKYRLVRRIGRAKAGRLLDGVEHNGFPKALS